MFTQPLIEEYREGLLECVHQGMICVVDANGIRSAVGDPQWMCYYRSASKGIQALPVLMHGLDKKYGLTDEETAIFAGSHTGDDEHVRILESILEKTGLREEDMIMTPCYAQRNPYHDRDIAQGYPRRTLRHNCSGKHLGMMLLTRELGLPVSDYWKRGTRTQEEILSCISVMTDFPKDKIRVGVDGCGVPVYAAPFHRLALSYLRLARPELIPDERVAEAAKRIVHCMHAYPRMISGEGMVCSLLCADKNLIGKAGAQGVYCMGIADQGLGVVYKAMDGSQDEYDLVVLSVLEQLGVSSPALDALRARGSHLVINNNNEIVGEKKTVFTL